MKKAFFFLSVLLKSIQVHSQATALSPDFDAKEAFQAGHFQVALEKYEELLKNTEDPLTKEILQYNISSSLLKEEMWQEGTAALRDLNTNKNLFPILKEKVFMNLASSKFQGAIAFLEEGTLESLLLARILGQVGEKLNESIPGARCEIDLMEGAKECAKAASEPRFKSFSKKLEKMIDDKLMTVINNSLDKLEKGATTKPSPLLDLELKLGNAYREAILTSFQKENLEKVISLLDEMGKSLEKGKAQEIESAKNLASLSKEMLTKSPFNAKTVFYGSLVSFKNFLESKEVTENLPMTTLRAAIHTQKLNLFLVRGLDAIQDVEPASDSLKKWIENQQGQVIKVAEDYPKDVITWQKEQYLKGDACLENPWNQAIPLFYSGLREALLAQKILSLKEEVLLPLIRAQARAVSYWEHAEDSMKEALESPSPKPEESKEAQKESKEDQMIRDVIQMQQDDSELIPPPSGYKPEMVPYPW